MDTKAQDRARPDTSINYNWRTISPSTRHWFNEVWSTAVGTSPPLLSMQFIPGAGRRLLERSLRNEVEASLCALNQESAAREEYARKANFLMPDPDRIWTVRVHGDSGWQGTPGLPALELSGWPTVARMETMEELWSMNCPGDQAFKSSLHTLIDKPECDLARLGELMGLIGNSGGCAHVLGSRLTTLFELMATHGYTPAQMFELASAGMDTLGKDHEAFDSAIGAAIFNVIARTPDKVLLEFLLDTVMRLPDADFLRFWSLQYDGIEAPQTISDWASALHACPPGQRAILLSRITDLLDAHPEEVAARDKANVAQALIAIVCIAGQKEFTTDHAASIFGRIRPYVTDTPAEHARLVQFKHAKLLHEDEMRQRRDAKARGGVPAAKVLPPFHVPFQKATDADMAELDRLAVRPPSDGQSGFQAPPVPERSEDGSGAQSASSATATPAAIEPRHPADLSDKGPPFKKSRFE